MARFWALWSWKGAGPFITLGNLGKDPGLRWRVLILILDILDRLNLSCPETAKWKQLGVLA